MLIFLRCYLCFYLPPNNVTLSAPHTTASRASPPPGSLGKNYPTKREEDCGYFCSNNMSNCNELCCSGERKNPFPHFCACVRGTCHAKKCVNVRSMASGCPRAQDVGCTRASDFKRGNVEIGRSKKRNRCRLPPDGLETALRGTPVRHA